MVTQQVESWTRPLSQWFDNLVKPTYTVKVTKEQQPIDITVQVKSDGMVVDCNHAGAIEGVLVKEFTINGHDVEAPYHATLCDKCPCWQDSEGDWNE